MSKKNSSKTTETKNEIKLEKEKAKKLLNVSIQLGKN